MESQNYSLVDEWNKLAISYAIATAPKPHRPVEGWSLLTRQVSLNDNEIKRILAGEVISLPPEKEIKHRDYQTYGEARYWQERTIREKGPAFTAVVRNKKAR